MLNNEKKNFLQVFTDIINRTEDQQLAEVLKSKSPSDWLQKSLDFVAGLTEIEGASLEDQLTIAISAVLHRCELMYVPRFRYEILEEFLDGCMGMSSEKYSQKALSLANVLLCSDIISLGLDFTDNNKQRALPKKIDEGETNSVNPAMPSFVYYMQKHQSIKLELADMIDALFGNSNSLIDSFVNKIKQQENELQDLRLKVARYEEDKRRSIPKGVAKVVTFNGILHFIESCNSVEEAKPYEAMLYKLMRSGNVEEKDYERIDEAMAKVHARENRFGNNFYAPITNNGTINGDVKNNQDKKNEQ